MTTTWIVAADPTLGRVIQIDGNAPAEVCVFERDESAIDGEPKPALPTKTFETVDGERQALKVEREPDEPQRVAFTRQIGDYVEHARLDHRFEKLVLVAEPKVLANLRKELSGETMKLVSSEVSRNVARENIEQIRSYLAPYL